MLMDKKLLSSSLELWGGIECTINRIGDFYFDQLQYAKHHERENDIALIAELGIKTLRYPLLWEYHQPKQDQESDWSWAEKQLETLRTYHITPVAGLLHHGSGPVFTSLLDEDFPTKFAEYAKQVAIKFPWLELYTPINEPLTTARFSGLYGLWFPHIKNDICFARMLLNQVKGIILAMQEIRKINPAARLVQTEDLGKTYSTPYLQFQAQFENERRWLTFDLLCGNVKPGHAMWEYFFRLGIPEGSLRFFLENPCPPDIAGFNYYVTSERFLDENIEKYPSYTHGGNELQIYADVEASRALSDEQRGLSFLLKEAWERFKLPMAITEAHLNCGREEQLRWLKEIWDICLQLKNEGLPIKAVTAWSLFGAFGWNRLLTSKKMDYEPGAFDLRSGVPRPTALTTLIRSLAVDQSYSHPLIEQKGWWHRDTSLITSPSLTTVQEKDTPNPLLIIGKRGALGNAFAKVCEARGIHYMLLGREDVNITNKEQIELVIKKYNPWCIINAAGFARVDDAETEIEKCFNDNKTGPTLLASACRDNGIQFMTFSSHLVFDGDKRLPYLESDKINPLNIYGKSKAEAEAAILLANPSTLIIRTSSFFGPWDEYNFVSNVVNTLSANKNFTAANDVFISPTYVPDLVNVSLDLLIDNEKGIWHLTNKGETSWADLAINVSQKAGLDTGLINSLPMHLLNWKAVRPNYSVLKTEKGIVLPSLENALTRYFQDRIAIPAEMYVINS